MTNLSEIQVDGSALRHNLAALKGLAKPGTKIAAVVKGNAYGHGLREVVGALEGQADFFQVDDLEELAALRQVTASPALVLGYIPVSAVHKALELGAEIAVYDVAHLQAAQKAAKALGKKARVHVKIDALLGRQGLFPEDVPGFLSAAASCPDVEIAAVYGHFANIEDTTDQAHVQAQVQVFEQCLDAIRARFPKVSRHLSATSGLMTYEQTGVRNDLVRLGIGLYGLYPSAALGRTHEGLGLQPAMRWVTHLAQVKTLPAGHPVGYGLTYFAPAAIPIGVVPQGYSDGYDRGFSNVGRVLVGGQSCPVLGRVAMNMFVVDLRKAPDATAEDEVVLLGRQGSECITAEELASQIGTINYEITTRVSPLLPRVLV